MSDEEFNKKVREYLESNLSIHLEKCFGQIRLTVYLESEKIASDSIDID